jgi:hypothetical protein
VEETANSSCEIKHCVWGCEKGWQLYELLLMSCAAVQQLPHVRRGACDWTVGGAGGEMLWFQSMTVGGSVLRLRNKLHILCKVVNYFKKIKLSKFLSNFTPSFYERKLSFVKQNGQFYKNKM